VRVHSVGGRAPIEGTVLGWTADTLVLGPLHLGRSIDTVARLPRERIASYQPSLGRDVGRGLGRGAKTGALIGGSGGVLLLITGVIADARACSDCIVIPFTVITGVLAVGTTLGGTFLGMGIGALAAPERWGDAQSVASSGYPSRSRRLALVLSIAR
jgi:hypothetical protein